MSNWENRRLPYFARLSDLSRLQTALSMQRLADLASFYKAQVWILHETKQTKTIKHSPGYYE